MTDEQYLNRRGIEPDYDQLENYSERVNVAMWDGGLDEETARRVAFNRVFEQ